MLVKLAFQPWGKNPRRKFPHKIRCVARFLRLKLFWKCFTTVLFFLFLTWEKGSLRFPYFFSSFWLQRQRPCGWKSCVSAWRRIPRRKFPIRKGVRFLRKKLQNSSFQSLPKFDVFHSVWDTEKKHVLFTTKLHGRSLSCGPFTQLSGSSLKDNEWSPPQWKPACTPSWMSLPNASSESSSSKREELLNPSPPVTKMFLRFFSL